jgi:hypothetical protein
VDGILLLAILVLLASAAVLVGTVVFFVWAALYFGRRAYRRATRRHRYVPVEARVTRAWHHRDGATLYVAYEFGGAEVVNRGTFSGRNMGAGHFLRLRGRLAAGSA